MKQGWVISLWLGQPIISVKVIGHICQDQIKISTGIYVNATWNSPKSINLNQNLTIQAFKKCVAQRVY